jgi:hypothetical protein
MQKLEPRRHAVSTIMYLDETNRQKLADILLVRKVLFLSGLLSERDHIMFPFLHILYFSHMLWVDHKASCSIQLFHLYFSEHALFIYISVNS